MAVEPGQMLSHYRLVEKIGQGGMGIVYKARDEKLRRHVALKVLPPEFVANEERRLRFMREARAAAAINHPNIATVHEVDEADGVVFIAMELIEGRTLRSLIRERPLSIPEALRIATGVADGLARAHRSGVVHRDLKPENIIVGTEGQVKVLDFGLAKYVEQRTDISQSDSSRAETLTLEPTRERRVFGTTSYMSPEQARGERVDARSDLFSFGITLYEMVTGRRPFGGGTDIEILTAILREPAVPPSRYNPGIPPDLDTLLGRCLEKDPTKRFQDSQELVLNLERLKEASGTYSPSMWFPLVRGMRTLRRWVVRPAVLIPSLVVALAVAGVALFRQAPPSPPGNMEISPNTIAVLPFTVRGGEEIAYLDEAMVDLLSWRLDGAGELRTVDPQALLIGVERLGGSTVDPLQGRTIAARLGAGLYVGGSIVGAGDGLHISAALYETTGAESPVAQATVEGPIEGLLGLVNDLAAPLLTGRIDDAGDRMTQLAGETTDSFPALKEFLLGLSHHRAGRYDPAVEAFQRAVIEDPAFALAHYFLARSAEGSPIAFQLAPAAVESALQHIDRLPERYRPLVEAYGAYLLRKDPEETIRILRRVVGRHPDDLEAWLQLGQALFHYGRWQGLWLDEARAAFEMVLTYDPDNRDSLEWLQWLSGLEEKYEESAAWAERALRNRPDGDYSRRLRADLAFAGGDQEVQDEAIDELRGYDTLRLWFSVHSVGLWYGNFEGAGRIADLLTEPSRSPEWRAEGYRDLAHLDLARGRWHDAMTNLSAAAPFGDKDALEDRALLSIVPLLDVPRDVLESIRDEISGLDFDPVWAPIDRAYLLGMLAVRLDDFSSAAGYADELDAIRREHETGEGGNARAAGRFARELGHSLRAEVFWAQGRIDDALVENEQIPVAANWAMINPSTLFSSKTHDRYMRGMLLAEQGEDREALRWLGSLGQVSFYEIAYLAPKHLRMAEIYERLGESARAVEHYTRFTDLWSDCDPELMPLVDDARDRILRLGG